MEIECNCPGCGETFANPRILPCKHVYCVNCIQKMSKTPVDLLDASKGTKSCCFICEAAFTLTNGKPDSLPQAEEYLGHVETYKNAATFMSFKCEEHTEKEAVKRCLSGCGHICQECVSAHATLRILKSHQLQDIDKTRPVIFESICSKHARPFKDVCGKLTENPFICDVCTGSHFKELGIHEHDSYEAGTKEFCDSLQENKIKIVKTGDLIKESEVWVGEKRKEIENYISELKKEASSEFEKAKNALAEEERRFMEKIDRFKKSILGPYVALGVFLETFKVHLAYSSKFIDESMVVFTKDKSPLKLPAAKRISDCVLQKRIVKIPEEIKAFSEKIPTLVLFPKESSEVESVPIPQQLGTLTRHRPTEKTPNPSAPAQSIQPAKSTPVAVPVKETPKESITTKTNRVIDQIGGSTAAINQKKSQGCPEYSALGQQMGELQTLMQQTEFKEAPKKEIGGIFDKVFEVIKKDLTWVGWVLVVNFGFQGGYGEMEEYVLIILE